MLRTVIHPNEAAFLTDPAAATSDRVKRLDIWLVAKERQGQPITVEAGNRLHDLEQRVSGRCDFVHIETPGVPAPARPASAGPAAPCNTMEGIRQRAHAKARAYIDSLRSPQGGAA